MSEPVEIKARMDMIREGTIPAEHMDALGRRVAMYQAQDHLIEAVLTFVTRLAAGPRGEGYADELERQRGAIAVAALDLSMIIQGMPRAERPAGWPRSPEQEGQP